MIIEYPDWDRVYDSWYIDPMSSMSRTVWEEEESHDIGLKDSFGNPLTIKTRKEPIGFVHFK